MICEKMLLSVTALNISIDYPFYPPVIRFSFAVIKSSFACWI